MDFEAQNSETGKIIMIWTGKKLIYKNGRGERAEIIAEDKTHILIKFDSGEQIVTNKNRYEYEELE